MSRSMSYSWYRSTAMPMAIAMSAIAPLTIAFCRLLAALPGPMIHSTGPAAIRAAARTRAPA